MDLIDKFKGLAQKIENQKEYVKTEEATKNSYIMPFIAALGYDVFNPLEVEPEFTADIGDKKGEKVDYCIKQNGNPVIIIECKHWKDTLNSRTVQLQRYFNVTKARFGILTNGIVYQFFTDLDDHNIMDSKPFFEFSMEKLTDSDVNELKKFQSTQFNVDEILSNASNLKYSKAIREFLSEELKNPSEDFVKLVAQKTYNGRVTAKILEQFNGLVQKAAKQYLSEMISDRLNSALAEVKDQNAQEAQERENEADIPKIDEGIVTTEMEIEGYRIVQAILRRVVPLERVTHN